MPNTNQPIDPDLVGSIEARPESTRMKGRIRGLVFGGVAFGVVTVAWALLMATLNAQRLNIQIRKETTRVLEPLTSDGFVDYELAYALATARNVPPSDNAAVVLLKILDPDLSQLGIGRDQQTKLALAHKLGLSEYPIAHSQFASVRDLYLRDVDEYSSEADELLGNWYDDSDKLFEPWTKDQFPEWSNGLDELTPCFEIIAQAAKCKSYWMPDVYVATDDLLPASKIDAWNPIPHSIRDEIVTALQQRAMRSLGEGNTKAAIEDIKTLHRLAVLVAKGVPDVSKTLLFGRVSYATCQLLRTEQMDRQQINDLQEFFQSSPLVFDNVPYIDQRIRFSQLAMIQQISSSGVSSVVEIDAFKKLIAKMKIDGVSNSWHHSNHRKAVRLHRFASRAKLQEAMRHINSWNDRYVDAVKCTSMAETRKLVDDLDTELELLVSACEREISPESDASLQLTALAIDGFFTESLNQIGLMLAFGAHDQSIYDQLLVGLALAEFKLVNERYPDNLSDLVPNYMEAIPIDQLNNRAFDYRVDAEGVLLYSWGWDGEDGGGAHRVDSSTRIAN